MRAHEPAGALEIGALTRDPGACLARQRRLTSNQSGGPDRNAAVGHDAAQRALVSLHCGITNHARSWRRRERRLERRNRRGRVRTDCDDHDLVATLHAELHPRHRAACVRLAAVRQRAHIG